MELMLFAWLLDKIGELSKVQLMPMPLNKEMEPTDL